MPTINLLGCLFVCIIRSAWWCLQLLSFSWHLQYSNMISCVWCFIMSLPTFVWVELGCDKLTFHIWNWCLKIICGILNYSIYNFLIWFEGRSLWSFYCVLCRSLLLLFLSFHRQMYSSLSRFYCVFIVIFLESTDSYSS